MPTTPEEWLPVLAKRLDARAPRIEHQRSYSNGNAPMPEMGENTRAAWQAFQQKARGGFGYLIGSALAQRLVPIGVTVGGSSENEPALVARRIYRDNRMDVSITDAITDALEVSIGYLVVGEDNGRAVITRELPEQCIAATDPLAPWRARAFFKKVRDSDMGFEYGWVWADGTRQKFQRPILEHGRYIDATEKWVAVGEPETYSGRPPVIVLENRDGYGEYERHTDLIDRINLGVLHRMVVVAMQAFRQRAIKSTNGEGLPKQDEAGNDIDYAKVFEPAPGALWDLSDYPVDIWESQVTDIQQLLTAVKDDLRDLSAVSETPLAMLVPDGANQTAEGAAFQRESIVFKARDRIRRFSQPLAMVLVYALRIEGIEDVETVELLWEPPDRVSVSEKYAAAEQAVRAGEPWRSVARNILGYSPEQIRQAELDRANDQLSAGLLGGPANADAERA